MFCLFMKISQQFVLNFASNIARRWTNAVPSHPYCSRVSKNLTQRISRRFHEGFQEKSRTYLHCFGLLCNVPNLLHLVEHVMMSSNQRSSLCYSTDYNISCICYTALCDIQWHISIIKAITGNQFYDRKPMWSIIYILPKKISRRTI